MDTKNKDEFADWSRRKERAYQQYNAKFKSKGMHDVIREEYAALWITLTYTRILLRGS